MATRPGHCKQRVRLCFTKVTVEPLSDDLPGVLELGSRLSFFSFEFAVDCENQARNYHILLA